ncbi:helix-turn-helix transcriptional regulator [Streptomyces sp. NPDC001840]
MDHITHNETEATEATEATRRRKPPAFTAAERSHAARVVSLIGPIVPVLAEALKPRTEVVLHDLTRMPNTIAAIGGTITGREVGGPATDLGLRAFRSGRREHLIRYRTETADGTAMRSSSIFLHAPSGKPVACLCLNTDISALEHAQQILNALTAASQPDEASPDASTVSVETFPESIDTLAEGLIREAITAIGVPVELMKKAHKKDIVRELDSRGFFTIREGISIAAQRLAVSRPTIYNYLNEIAADGSEEDFDAAF